MLIDPTPVSYMWAVYAIAALALTIIVLRAPSVTPGNLALGAILLQQFFGTLAAFVQNTATTPELAIAAFHGGVFFWLLWAPAVFVAGPMLLWKSDRRRVALWIGIGGAAPSVLLVIGAMVERSLLFAPDGVSLTALARFCLLWTFVGYAVTVGMIAREALTTPLPIQRAQLGLLSAAFAGEGMFHASQNTAKLLFGYDLYSDLTYSIAERIVAMLPFVLFLGILAYAIQVLRSPDEPARKPYAKLLIGFIAISAVTGGISAPVFTADEYNSPIGVFHALWDLASLCLLVFAGLRFQLFDLELRAKKGLVASLFVILGVGLFQVAQDMMEDLVSATWLGWLPANKAVAVILVAIMSVPILELARRVGTRLFPGVDRTQEYERKRKEEIYCAAVEGAMLDGHVSAAELNTLKRLRASLGISDAEHKRIEAGVRGHLASAG